MYGIRTTIGPGLVLVGLMGCAKPPAAKSESRPVPVLVVKAVKKSVPVQVRTIGTVKALASVSIRPRVGGQLTDVFFREGEYVRKAQKLFEIDPRPYLAAVKQAEASLAKSLALQKGAELDLKRVEQAGTGGAVSAIEIDAARTAAASALATVGIDRAAVETAKLQLSYCTITAPLDGRVGELLINQGNLVDAASPNPLVVINQISPITVAFALPETHLPAVSVAMRSTPLRVDAFLRDGGPPATGSLAFVDNAVNTGSGTVQLKAEFPNLDHSLWPGQYVDVVLTIRERPESVLVPTAAVQSGQKGAYVYVVTADGKARYQAVTVAFETGAHAVIEAGLKGDETVVTEGQLRLVEGTVVSPKSQPAAGGEGPG